MRVGLMCAFTVGLLVASQRASAIGPRASEGRRVKAAKTQIRLAVREHLEGTVPGPPRPPRYLTRRGNGRALTWILHVRAAYLDAVAATVTESLARLHHVAPLIEATQAIQTPKGESFSGPMGKAWAATLLSGRDVAASLDAIVAEHVKIDRPQDGATDPLTVTITPPDATVTFGRPGTTTAGWGQVGALRLLWKEGGGGAVDAHYRIWRSKRAGWEDVHDNAMIIPPQ